MKPLKKKLQYIEEIEDKKMLKLFLRSKRNHS